MISGILNVNKEVGISSNKCVSLVKKALNTKKVGHTGTLDLEAGGVLPIVIGKATRVSDYMMGHQKEYITEVIFGKRTDTLDAAGEITDQSDVVFDKDELISAMKNYEGSITQIPPMYSALKVKGEKLYDLARKGIEVARKPRNVNIYEFELLDFDFPKAKFRIKSSKGTYIRTLIDDLGEDLKSFAYVNILTRTKVGDFDICDAIDSDELLQMNVDEIIYKLKPVDFALKDFKKFNLDKSYLKQAINGMTMRVDRYIDSTVRVYIDDIFIGLGNNFKDEDEYFLKMEKVFYEQ